MWVYFYLFLDINNAQNKVQNSNPKVLKEMNFGLGEVRRSFVS